MLEARPADHWQQLRDRISGVSGLLKSREVSSTLEASFCMVGLLAAELLLTTHEFALRIRILIRLWMLRLSNIAQSKTEHSFKAL